MTAKVVRVTLWLKHCQVRFVINSGRLTDGHIKLKLCQQWRNVTSID